MERGTPRGAFGWQQGTVLLGGVLVFVLLIMADKGSLNNDRSEDVKEENNESPASVTEKENLLSLIPTIELPGGLGDTLASLEKGEGSPELREKMYRSVVEGLSREGRYDGAAVFAARLAEEQPTTKNLLVAGALLRNSCELPRISEDTMVFSKFIDRSISFLEEAGKKDTANVDVLLELGLAYVGSRKAEFGMPGIMKLRKVLEIDPQNAEASFHLGRLSLDTGQFDKAEGRFKRVLELRPGDLKAKYYLAITYKNLGNEVEFKKLMTEVAGQKQNSELAALADQVLKKSK